MLAIKKKSFKITDYNLSNNKLNERDCIMWVCASYLNSIMVVLLALTNHF